MVKRMADSQYDREHGKATYDLENGKWATFYKYDVERYGLETMLEAVGFTLPDPAERVPVIQSGKTIGSVPALFDPLNVKPTAMFDPRPGDLQRFTNGWVASETLGPGDLEALPGFVWDKR